MDNNTNAEKVAETSQETQVNAQIEAKSTEGKETIATEKVATETAVTTEATVEKVDGAFPTSIKPIKAQLEPLRPTAAEMPTITVEVIHVVVFVLITAFIFLSMWNEARKKS